MKTFATLADALTALPVGPEAIADHLLEMGVQGSCNEPGECAIADYLTRTVAIPAGHVVQVANVSASIRRVATRRCIELCWFAPAGVGQQEVDRPDITEFIHNFDRGQYPLLVASSYAEQVSA